LDTIYNAAPTAVKMHASKKVVRGYLGPVGNGKSVCCIMDAFSICLDQWPNSEGVRKSRFVLVRNTGPELRTTTLKTFQQWIPPRICHIALNPVIQGTMRQDLGDGTSIEMEVIFLSIDRPQDVKKLLGIESTVIFLNEAREMPYATVRAARERIGRYPNRASGYEDVYDDSGNLIYDAPKERDEDGQIIYGKNGDPIYTPCKRKAILMDTNPPDTDHWWYQLAEEGCFRKSKNKDFDTKETERIFGFFRGTPPLIEKDGIYIENPDAENIENLPGGYQYYLDMIAGNTPDYISVMVLGNYGTIMEGKPVYPQYNDRFHCPEKAVGAIPGIPICLGWDFGLTPACVIGQLTDIGQCRIIWELVSDDMSAAQFARDVVKPFLQQYFDGWTIGFSFGDPAGNNRGEGEGKSAIGILNDAYVMDGDTPLDMGFTTEPAPTNDITRRVNAVQSFMSKMCGAGEPGYLLSNKCKELRKGKLGGYHYKTIGTIGSELTKTTPHKNMASHSADAEQYLCLGFQGGYVVDVAHDEEENYQPRHVKKTGTM
jgi:hypothetical protein